MVADESLDYGCAFPVNEDRPVRFCGCRRRLGSSYCEIHHALCYVPRGSVAERREVMMIEALAELVGGRINRAQPLDRPPEMFLWLAARLVWAA